MIVWETAKYDPDTFAKKSFARFSGRDDTPTVRSCVADPLSSEKTQSVRFREEQGSRRDISSCMERLS